MIEEMFAKRGITVDHTTIHRWVITYAPNTDMMLTLKTIGTTNYSAWHAEKMDIVFPKTVPVTSITDGYPTTSIQQNPFLSYNLMNGLVISFGIME